MLNSVAGIDRKNSFRLVPTFYQVPGHDSNAISAHFGKRTIGISVIHKPFAVSLDHSNQTISTDTCFSITYRRRLGGRNGVFIARIENEYKIVFGTVAIRCNHCY